MNSVIRHFAIDRQVNSNDFRGAMRQLTGGVSVITAGHGSDISGMTVTSVSSLSVDPPALIVSINRSASSWPLLKRYGCFGVNTLTADQIDIAERFTGKDGLKGATIAISRFGSNADVALRLALKQAGLDPAKDVTIVQLGTQPERLAALNSRRIQATLMSPPFSSAAKKTGLKVLLDISRMRIAYPQIGLVSSRDYITKNRANARGFVQAYLEAIRDLKKNKEATVKLLAKYLRMDLENNRDILLDTYDENIASDELEKRPYPNRDGMKLAIELIAKQRNISPIPNIDNFMDTSLLAELDRSGFIDQLYR